MCAHVQMCMCKYLFAGAMKTHLAGRMLLFLWSQKKIFFSQHIKARRYTKEKNDCKIIS